MRSTLCPHRPRAVRAIGLLMLLALLFSFSTQAFAAPPHDTPESYTVRSGDTLFSIATRYQTTVAALKQLNGLKGDLIQVGQKLVLPTAEGSSVAAVPASAKSESYVVQPGDSLYRIALHFGTTSRALADLNGIANPNLIAVGQALAIPGSTTLAKPGLTISPLVAQQGGTVLIKVARPDLESVTGSWGDEIIRFTQGAGYFYGLVGVSRCAKVGSAALTLKETDTAGQTATETVTFRITATDFPVQAITLPPDKGGLLDPTLLNREAAELNAVVAKYSPTRLWSGSFRQPLVGVISTGFGDRRSYNGGPVGACGHEGIDLAVPGGTPIYADARGRVVFAGLTQVRGNLTVVDHGLGVYSAYFHQSEMDVKVGQMVEAGDLIGKVGTTGLSTGNHLHWSLFVDGEYVDPFEWTKRVFP